MRPRIVITGTTGDFTVRKNYPKAQILDMVYAADAALAVQTRKADAFVFDRNTLQYIIARSNNAFELLPERVATVDIAIPMRSANTELHKKVNAVIARFQQDGTLQSLKAKWIDSPPRDPQPPNIVLSGKNGVLRLGSNLFHYRISSCTIIKFKMNVGNHINVYSFHFSHASFSFINSSIKSKSVLKEGGSLFLI